MAKELGRRELKNVRHLLGPRREGDATGGAALISDQKLLFRSGVTGGSFRLSIRGPECYIASAKQRPARDWSDQQRHQGLGS